MATFHCSVKAGKSGSGGAHADYIEREGKYASKSKDDLEHKETGNLPKFAETSGEFWRAADKGEGDKKKPYREYEIALPRELTKEQRLELVREFVRQEIGDKYTYTFAIHNPTAAIDGGEQPHAHIMFSERIIDGIDRPAEQYFKRWNAKNPEKGGCKKGNNDFKTAVTRAAELVQLRERFAELQNKHLAKAGHEVRVTHLSLAAQGIEREVEPHLGPKRIKELGGALKIDREASIQAQQEHQQIVEQAKERAREHVSRLRERQETALEAPEAPEAPKHTGEQKNAAYELYRHVSIHIDSAERVREAEKRKAEQVLDQAKESKRDDSLTMQRANEQGQQLGKRPLLMDGKWLKQHQELRTQFEAAQARSVKAQERIETLGKIIEGLQEPRPEDKIKAACKELNLPFTRETMDKLQLGSEVNTERKQEQAQVRAMQREQERAQPKQERGMSR